MKNISIVLFCEKYMINIEIYEIYWNIKIYEKYKKMSENKETLNCDSRNTTNFSSTIVLLFYDLITILSFWNPQGCTFNNRHSIEPIDQARCIFPGVRLQNCQKTSWFWFIVCKMATNFLIMTFLCVGKWM